MPNIGSLWRLQALKSKPQQQDEHLELRGPRFRTASRVVCFWKYFTCIQDVVL